MVFWGGTDLGGGILPRWGGAIRDFAGVAKDRFSGVPITLPGTLYIPSPYGNGEPGVLIDTQTGRPVGDLIVNPSNTAEDIMSKFANPFTGMIYVPSPNEAGEPGVLLDTQTGRTVGELYSDNPERGLAITAFVVVSTAFGHPEVGLAAAMRMMADDTMDKADVHNEAVSVGLGIAAAAASGGASGGLGKGATAAGIESADEALKGAAHRLDLPPQMDTVIDMGSAAVEAWKSGEPPEQIARAVAEAGAISELDKATADRGGGGQDVASGPFGDPTLIVDPSMYAAPGVEGPTGDPTLIVDQSMYAAPGAEGPTGDPTLIVDQSMYAAPGAEGPTGDPTLIVDPSLYIWALSYGSTDDSGAAADEGEVIPGSYGDEFLFT